MQIINNCHGLVVTGHYCLGMSDMSWCLSVHAGAGVFQACDFWRRASWPARIVVGSDWVWYQWTCPDASVSARQRLFWWYRLVSAVRRSGTQAARVWWCQQTV